LFSSTIIPTIARPTLERAVDSVLRQESPGGAAEVIVVNDSGHPLPPADWQRSTRVRVVHTDRRERGVARNTGAAMANGRYLHFLDDDDWLLPGALRSLHELSQQASQAVWLYGGSQLVDRRGEPLVQLHHDLQGNCFAQMMAGEWIPIQSSLIDTNSFFAAGGFHPLLVAGGDTHLGRQLALRGDLASTEAVVCCICMGQEGSSTDHNLRPKLVRWARELTLKEPKALAKMVHSARSSSRHRSYWYGRVMRVYLTSVIWNLQHRKPFAAASRAMHALAALALAGRHLASAGYWQAVARQYKSFTFARGFDAESNHGLRH
jgi:hypothetical protein